MEKCGVRCGILCGSAFKGKIPTDWKGREVVALVRLTSLGPEGFAAEGAIYQNGRLIRALNLNRREVEITAKAKGGERFEFFVEAAANGGTNSTGDAIGLNLPDYHGKPLFRLEQAELACRNSEAFDFYFDFKFAAEAMDALPENSQRRAELRYALNESVNEFDQDDPSTIKRAAAALRGVMRRRQRGYRAHAFRGRPRAHRHSLALAAAGDDSQVRPHVFHRAELHGEISRLRLRLLASTAVRVDEGLLSRDLGGHKKSCPSRTMGAGWLHVGGNRLQSGLR